MTKDSYVTSCLYRKIRRTIEHFSKQVKESFYHVLTYAKATKIIDKIREKYDIIILFEQTDIQRHPDIGHRISTEEISRNIHGTCDGFTHQGGACNI